MLKSLVKDTAIYGMADFFFKLVNFATFPIFAHLFTVDEFGLFSLATTLAALISVVFNCGLNNAVQRYYMDPNTTKEQQPLFVSSGLLSLVSLSLVIGASTLILSFYFRDAIYARDQLPWGLIALAILGTLPTQIYQFCLDIIRLYFKPWSFALLNGIQSGLSIALSLYFVLYWKMGVEGYLLGSVVSFVAVVPMGLWGIRHSLRWQFDWNISKTLLAFGYPFIFSGIAYWIFASMDRWMLVELGTTTEVGMYSTAFKFGTIMIFFNTAFGQAWSPHALQLYKTEPNYKALYSSFFTLWFYFLILVATAISLFSSEALRLVTPESYWPSANIIPYIAFGMVFCGTTQITGIGISLEKKTFHFSVATWLTAAINFSLNLYLIPIQGAEGAALATLISYGVLTSYYAVCTQYQHPLPFEKKKIAICFLMIPCTLSFALFMQSQPWALSSVIIKGAYLSLLIVGGGLFNIYRIKDLYPSKLNPSKLKNQKQSETIA